MPEPVDDCTVLLGRLKDGDAEAAEPPIDAGSLEAECGASEDASRTLDQTVRAAESLPVSARLCLALAHRARVTGNGDDAARARVLLDSERDSFALYDRIDASRTLFVATGDPALRELARRDLERMRAHAAPEDQAGLRGRLPLYRAVSSAG